MGQQLFLRPVWTLAAVGVQPTVTEVGVPVIRVQGHQLRDEDLDDDQAQLVHVAGCEVDHHDVRAVFFELPQGPDQVPRLGRRELPVDLVHLAT